MPTTATTAPPLDRQLVTRAYTDSLMKQAGDALSSAQAASARVDQVLASSDSQVASQVKNGSLTRAELDTWIAAKNFVTPSAIDGQVAQNVNASRSLTRAALASLIQATAPTSSGSSGGTTVITGGASPSFNVEDFRKSGMSDDATVRACIQAAVASAQTYEHPEIVFASRKYQVTNGVLNDYGSRVVQVGLSYRGQGYTTLELVGGGWFYDNGVTTDHDNANDHRKLSFGRFDNIRFTSPDATVSTPANGFRFTGQTYGHEQNYLFVHCNFVNLDQVFRTEGNLNTDSIRLLGCYMSQVNYPLTLCNTQALLMEWVQTSVELCRKDCFRVLAGKPNGFGGGGDIKIWGGSYVMDKDASDTSSSYALLRLEASDNLGQGNANFLFNGIRTEMRSPDCAWVIAPGEAGMATVDFVDCNLWVCHANPRAMVLIGNMRRVNFKNCVIPDAARFVFDVPWRAQVQAAPSIDFDGCDVGHTDFATTISWKQTNRFGIARARRNRSIPNGNVSDWTRAVINDFDLNGLQGNFQAPGLAMKIAAFFPSTSMDWPKNDSQPYGDYRLVLPPGAMLRRIVLARPASGGSTTPYALQVTNDDASVVYGQSATGDFGKATSLEVAPNVVVGSDMTSRTVRLRVAPSAKGDNTQVVGGFAYVEYI